jgi:hypothetical protein
MTSKAMMAVVAAGALVAGGLVGGGVGAVAAVATAKPHGPSAPPPVADLPNGSQRYLPGVKVSAISDGWLKQKNNWTCEPDDSKSGPSSGAKQQLNCTAPGELSYLVNVEIEYDDETHVRVVDADCAPVIKPGNAYCTSTFGNLAELIVGSTKPDLHKSAQDWGSQNADSDKSTTIGGLRLAVTLDPHYIEITPDA